jgi:hypothetical protein
MTTLERIIEQATRLPTRDRRRVLDAVRKSLDNGKRGAKPKGKRVVRKVAGKGPYATSLAAAGTAHSDYTDVSSNKYKHLAEIYADNHEDT